VPLPRRLARFNRVVTNRLFGPLAGRVGPWALVEHTGRRSGRRYQTVVWAFPRQRDLVFALTYGPGADWVRNILRSQSARVAFAGRWRAFSRAEVVDGEPGLALLPAVVRPLLRVANVRSVLRLSGAAA
jgi:deazaflavin-dependent oxidoreductase (nitroreductase family)